VKNTKGNFAKISEEKERNIRERSLLEYRRERSLQWKNEWENFFVEIELLLLIWH